MTSTITALKSLFERDLDKLSQEIEAYQNEADLWVLAGSINNTAGNLCLHICGNLQHFFGHEMGKSDYVRKRENEFGLKNVAKSALLLEIGKARVAVVLGLDSLDETKLDQVYPTYVFGHEMTYSFFITSLYAHLSLHMGQINYHRRILSKP